MTKLKQLAARLAARLTAAWPINRVVVALTPLVFVPASGYVATWVPQHLPGLGFQPTSTQVLTLFLAGAGSALAAAYKWLDGWQKAEARTAIDGTTTK
jgi:hypothetical protein